LGFIGVFIWCFYHYFLSSSTINCVNLHSDPEFKLIFTDAVLDFESITQHPDILLALKISRKKLVRVYNVHGLSKKIAVGNVRIKYQSYIFFSPLSMFHLFSSSIKLQNIKCVGFYWHFHMMFSKKKRNNKMYLSIFMSSLIAWLLSGEVKSD
jgi:hypothetical protein